MLKSKKGRIMKLYRLCSEAEKQKRKSWADNFCNLGTADKNLLQKIQNPKEKV